MATLETQKAQYFSLFILMCEKVLEFAQKDENLR